MNAAPEVQLRLLDLQALDAALDQLAHRRRSLPEHAEAERLTGRLAELRSEIVTAETEDGDIGREQSKAEGDVEQVVARSERDQKRLDAGQVGSPRELENLQSEIASLAKRRSALEDTVLEIMERREGVQQRLDDLIKERATLTGELAAVEERRDAAVADIDGEAEQEDSRPCPDCQRDAGRSACALREDPRRARRGRRARCLAVGARAAICPSTTRRLSEIRNAAPDAVVRCEECRRILIRTPESGL